MPPNEDVRNESMHVLGRLVTVSFRFVLRRDFLVIFLEEDAPSLRC